MSSACERAGNANHEDKRREMTSSVPVAPDGGWGWAVCGGAFLCNVMLDGILFSFGVFFLELQAYFGESKGRTAFVGSLLMGMSLLMGPVVSVMINFWGTRVVAMAGGLLASLFFAISTLAPNLAVLTFTYGFLAGFGTCMVYISNIITVGLYFDKRRALANGITSSGSGIGTFIYSPLCSFLQEEFGWKGSLLILSAITLNCVACGALYRPLRERNRKNATKEDELKKENDVQTTKGPAKEKVLSNGSLQTDEACKLRYGINAAVWTRNHLLEANVLSSTLSLRDLQPSSKHVPASLSSSCRVLNQDTLKHRSIQNAFKPLSKSDLFYSGSPHRINEQNQSASVRSIASVTTKDGREKELLHSTVCDKDVEVVHESTDSGDGRRLFKQPVLYLCIVGMCLWTTHSTVLTLLPDYAVQEGISVSSAADLIAFIGATNTAARIMAGWLSDHPNVNCVMVNVVALLLGGLSCVGMAFTAHYKLLAAEACVFGFCMGTWTSLRPIILVDLLGIGNLTNALGLVALFQGVSFCVGPPIAGVLFEAYESYVAVFVTAGAAFILSGAVFTVVCRLRACCTDHHRTRRTEEETH